MLGGLLTRFLRHDGRSEAELLSRIKSSRPLCPFYGFVADIDTEGNGCGLEGDHTPCAMEMAQQTPRWDTCSRFNTPENAKALEKLLGSRQVYPKDLWPKEQTSWKGIPLRAWFDLRTLACMRGLGRHSHANHCAHSVAGGVCHVCNLIPARLLS